MDLSVNRDVELLHPRMRALSLELEQRLKTAGLLFQRFEGFRRPERQAQLYAQGRVPGQGTPGRHVTFMQAWQSAHQYGLAEDWVWKDEHGWSWLTAGDKRWTQFQSIARSVGLGLLSFETPHVQVPGFTKEAARTGHLYAGGDASWATNLTAAIMAWNERLPPGQATFPLFGYQQFAGPPIPDLPPNLGRPALAGSNAQPWVETPPEVAPTAEEDEPVISSETV